MDDQRDRRSLLLLLDCIAVILSTFIVCIVMGGFDSNLLIISCFFIGIKILCLGIGDITGMGWRFWTGAIFVLIADFIVIVVNMLMAFGVSRSMLMVNAIVDIIFIIIVHILWKKFFGDHISQIKEKEQWLSNHGEGSNDSEIDDIYTTLNDDKSDSIESEESVNRNGSVTLFDELKDEDSEQNDFLDTLPSSFMTAEVPTEEIRLHEALLYDLDVESPSGLIDTDAVNKAVSEDTDGKDFAKEIVEESEIPITKTSDLISQESEEEKDTKAEVFASDLFSSTQQESEVEKDAEPEMLSSDLFDSTKQESEVEEPGLFANSLFDSINQEPELEKVEEPEVLASDLFDSTNQEYEAETVIEPDFFTPMKAEDDSTDMLLLDEDDKANVVEQSENNEIEKEEVQTAQPVDRVEYDNIEEPVVGNKPEMVISEPTKVATGTAALAAVATTAIAASDTEKDEPISTSVAEPTDLVELEDRLGKLMTEVGTSNRDTTNLSVAVENFKAELEHLDPMVDDAAIVSTGSVVRDKLQNIIDKQYLVDEVLDDLIRLSQQINTRIDELDALELNLNKRQADIEQRERVLGDGKPFGDYEDAEITMLPDEVILDSGDSQIIIDEDDLDLLKKYLDTHSEI